MTLSVFVRLAGLVFLVAACGGTQDEAAAGEAEVDQAAIDEYVSGFRQFADRACACSDRTCAEVQLSLFAEWLHKYVESDSGWLASTQERVRSSQVRFVDCLADKGVPPDKVESSIGR